MNFARNGYFRLGPVMLALIVAGCSSRHEPKWAATNKKVIEESKVTGRTRELPQVKVPMDLVEGEAVEAGKLPSATFAPGVTAKLWWGRGALVEKIEMQPDAAYPEQTLGEELIIIGQDGSATVQFDGKTAEIAKDDVLYPSARRETILSRPERKAGRRFEVYSPVRLDHLALAGQNTSGVSVTFPDQGCHAFSPTRNGCSFERYPIYAFDESGRGKSYKRASSNSQLIWGKNAQISLVRMDPGSEFPRHIHPEDQLTHTLRGSLDQGVMDKSFSFTATAGNTVYLPGGMVHSAKNG
jgi:gluconolactonase